MMKSKKNIVDFEDRIKDALEKQNHVKAKAKGKGIPYALVPCAHDTDVRMEETGRFVKYMPVYSEKELEVALKAIKESLPAGLRGAAEAVADKTREILEASGLDADGHVPYLVVKKVSDDLFKVLAGKKKSGRPGKGEIAVRLDDIEKMSSIDWDEVKEKDVYRLMGFIEENKAKEFFEQFKEENLSEERTRDVPQRRVETEKHVETERTVETSRGIETGVEAENTIRDFTRAGGDAGAHIGENTKVRPDSSKSVSRSGEDEQCSEKSGETPLPTGKKPVKRSFRTRDFPGRSMG